MRLLNIPPHLNCVAALHSNNDQKDFSRLTLTWELASMLTFAQYVVILLLAIANNHTK